MDNIGKTYKGAEKKEGKRDFCDKNFILLILHQLQQELFQLLLLL